MRIGVSGASGKLGAATVKELVQRAQGHDIVAISRTPGTAATSGVESRLGDYDSPQSLTEAYKGLDRLLLIPTSDLRPGRRARQTIAAIDAASTGRGASGGIRRLTPPKADLSLLQQAVQPASHERPSSRRLYPSHD